MVVLASGVATTAEQSEYVRLGRAEEARRVWQELKEINPRYSFEDHMDRLPFKDPADAERIAEGVRKAGLLD